MMKIPKPGRFFYLLILAALIGLGLYFVSVRKVTRSLQTRQSEALALEAQLAKAREGIRLFKKGGPDKSLLPENEVSPALEEVTKLGNELGIAFLDVEPGKPEKLPDSPLRVLAVRVETESAYEALGRFLGKLDEALKNLVTIRSFEILPVTAGKPKVKSRLVLNLYLAE